MLWIAEGLGRGYSAPVVTDDKLLINGEIDSISHVFAFDLNGKLMWKTDNGPEFIGEGYSSSYPGSRSTPTVYNDLVYACSGLGRISCLEAASGKEKWAVELVRDLGGRFNMFGCSQSLMVDEKYVYCSPGGEISNIVALNRLTGSIVWASKGMGDYAGYASPIVITLPERKVLVTLSQKYMLGLDTRTGELLWSNKVDSAKLEGDHSNTPIYADEFIYNVAGEKNGNGVYKLKLSSDGKSVEEVWRNKNVSNPFNGFIKVNDKIFTTTQDKKLKSIDVHTGMVVDSVLNMRGSIAYADNRLYCYTDNGMMKLVDPTATKMNVVSKFKIEKGNQQHFAYPVISNGVMYIRHGDALMAYKIRE